MFYYFTTKIHFLKTLHISFKISNLISRLLLGSFEAITNSRAILLSSALHRDSYRWKALVYFKAILLQLSIDFHIGNNFIVHTSDNLLRCRVDFHNPYAGIGGSHSGWKVRVFKFELQVFIFIRRNFWVSTHTCLCLNNRKGWDKSQRKCQNVCLTKHFGRKSILLDWRYRVYWKWKKRYCVI